MFNQQPSMGQSSPEKATEKVYHAPDTADIKSWSNEKLKYEFAELEDEHKRLIEGMMRPDKETPNAEIVKKIKDLAVPGREMFDELETRKHPLNS